MTGERTAGAGRDHRLGWRTVFAIVATAALLATLAIVFRPGPLNLILYDNSPSGVACDDLPTRTEVEAALEAHAELADRIEAVDDLVDVHLDTPCTSDPDRAEIEIWHPSRNVRERIEDILKDESFGVPVSLRNV